MKKFITSPIVLILLTAGICAAAYFLFLRPAASYTISDPVLGGMDATETVNPGFTGDANAGDPMAAMNYTS